MVHSFSGLNHSTDLTPARDALEGAAHAFHVLFYAPRNLAAWATCSSLKLAMKKYEWS